jgi:hypothetical protein
MSRPRPSKPGYLDPTAARRRLPATATSKSASIRFSMLCGTYRSDLLNLRSGQSVASRPPAHIMCPTSAAPHLAGGKGADRLPGGVKEGDLLRSAAPGEGGGQAPGLLRERGHHVSPSLTMLGWPCRFWAFPREYTSLPRQRTAARDRPALWSDFDKSSHFAAINSYPDGLAAADLPIPFGLGAGRC